MTFKPISEVKSDENENKKPSKKIKEFISRPIFDENIIINKDPSWPKISIVTPSYNQAKFLERTILSVLNQNYPNTEYIIIDGSSTDGSIEIIKKYEKYLAYWVSEPDKGQADAINKGFLKSKGEILAWLNSDDIYLQNTLTKISKFFISQPNINIFYGDAYIIDENETIIREFREIPFSKNALIYNEINFIQPTVLLRREIFFKSGMLRTKFNYCLDRDLWLRFLKNNANFYHIPVPLACFRVHVSSKTVSNANAFLKESELINRELLSNDLYGFGTQLWHHFYLIKN